MRRAEVETLAATLMSFRRTIAVTVFPRVGADEGAGGRGAVESDAGEHEPGRVGGERAGWEMCQRRRFHVGVQVFDDRMVAVGFVGIDGAQGTGGEERVEAEQVKEGAFTGGDGLIEFRDATHDEPPENLLALLLRPERGEGNLGDFRVARSTARSCRRRWRWCI